MGGGSKPHRTTAGSKGGGGVRGAERFETLSCPQGPFKGTCTSLLRFVLPAKEVECR